MEWIIYADYVLFALFVLGLARLLYVRRKDISIQKILSIGKVPIIFLAMLRTTWGINLMESMAKKHGKAVRFYGYCSIGISMVAMIIAIWIFGLVAVKLFTDPIQASIAPALPFVNLPVIGYLSFTHWVLVIAFIATVHEFAHGVVSKAFGVPVKKSGIAILNLFLPIIPAAFVEPDEKKLRKNESAFYSTIAAGPATNIIFAGIFWLIILLLILPAQQALTHPVGFTLQPSNETGPAALAGITSEIMFTSVNGVPTTNATPLLEALYYYQPNMSITLEGINQTSNEQFQTVLNPTEHPDRAQAAYAGVYYTNEVRYKNEGISSDIFEWFFKLFRLLFLFNLFVGIINMLPVAIADGGQIFTYLLQSKKGNLGMKISGVITLLFLIIMLAGIGVWIYFSLTGGYANFP